MKYFLYNLNTGKVVSFLDSPEKYEKSFIDGLGIISAEMYSANDVNTTEVINGIVVSNAVVPRVSTNQIREMRVLLEDSPLDTTKGLFEGDQRSINRMSEAYANFDVLPLVDNCLEWRTASNTYVYFTRNELGALLNELAGLRAIRTNTLFRSYQTMLLTPNLTLEYVQNVDNWL